MTKLFGILLAFILSVGFLLWLVHGNKAEENTSTDTKINALRQPKSPDNLNTQITQQVSTPTLIIKEKYIHLYPYYGLDSKIDIGKINIIGIFFIAKDQKGTIKDEWNTNIQKVSQEIKSFFEAQFKNKIVINYKIVPSIKGDRNLEEYDITGIAQEIRSKTSTVTITGDYNIWMIYVIRDSPNNNPQGNLGAQPILQSAVMDEFWLDNEVVNNKKAYGLIGSAHEVGHVLGIPHPWELPANINHDPNFGNIPGDLMGYSNNDLSLQNMYIREDVKKEMGL